MVSRTIVPVSVAIMTCSASGCWLRLAERRRQSEEGRLTGPIIVACQWNYQPTTSVHAYEGMWISAMRSRARGGEEDPRMGGKTYQVISDGAG
jgi:hypothetical protein